MALPGLDEEDDIIPGVDEQDEVIHDLLPATEWRFEVAFTENVEIKLISGIAELFGTELAPQHTYRFRGVKGAVYSEYGCKLSSKGLLQSEYVAEETPMVQHVNLHFALQQVRDTGTGGPRILIMGPSDSGKTALARTLCAYTLRSSEHQVLAVNLDPRNGMLVPPGTLSASSIESIVDPETVTGWGSAPTNGPMPVPVKLPLVYYYGHEDPAIDEQGYKALVSKLALSITGRLNEEALLRNGGLVIDAPASLGTGKAAGLAEHVVSEFGVTVIAVIGSERLEGDLARRLTGTHVVRIDKSGGAVEKDDGFSERSRREQVHEYFYGDARVSLNPHSSYLDWTDVAIFKLIDQAATAMDSNFLPGGGLPGSQSTHQTVEQIREPTPELQGSVLAVVDANPSASFDSIRMATVIGFVHVGEVDDKRKRLKVLSPMSGRLPKRTLLWGSWPQHMEMDSTTVAR